MSLINSGQTGIWPSPTQKPSSPPPSVKHWKIQNYPKHWYEATDALKYSSNPFVLLPEMEFITKVLWHPEIYGQWAHSIPDRGRMINTTLLPDPTPLCFWLVLIHFPSLSSYYSNSEVQPAFVFFFQTDFKRAGSLSKMETCCPQLQAQAPTFTFKLKSAGLYQEMHFTLLA